MLSKEEFANYLDNFDIYWNNSTEVIIFLNIHEVSDINIITPVVNMLKTFLSSHFTEEGVNFILKWLLEDSKSTTLTYNDLFGGDDEKYVIDDIDKLWNYIKTDLLYA